MKRSIIGAILTVGLLAAPFAYAETNNVSVGDPYTDTIQLWSEIASALSSLGNDVAALFGHQLSSEPTASAQQGPASLAAAAGSFNNTEPPANTATSSEPISTTTSAPTTVSQNVTSTESGPSLPSILSSPTPAFDASNFVSQSELSSLLLTLRNSLAGQFSAGQTAILPQNVAADGNGAIPYAAENDIGNLSNVTITNANLTAAEIPALNYFPSTSTISTAYGGTGISNSPTFGQLLLGNGSGGYSLVSTSSLGIAGTNYWTLSGSSLFNNSGNNIGIGTTTPWSDIGNSSALLDLTSNGVVRLTLHDTASTQEEKLSSDGTGFYIDSAGAASASNNNIVFRVSNANQSYTTFEVGRFTAAGLFGIGTTSPWAQLSASSTSPNPVLAIQQNSTGPAAVFLGGSVGIGTTTPSSNALFSVGTSTSLLYVDNNTGAVDIGSTNATVAPFFVNGTFPKQVATLPTGYHDALVVSGNYLYGVHVISTGAPGSIGFSVYDISVPTNPILVSSTTISDPQFSNMNLQLRASGHYVYMVDDAGYTPTGNIKVFDVSNPSSPVAVVPTTGGITDTNFPWGFDVAGRYLYSSGGSSQFNVIDISDPLNRITVASPSLPGNDYFTEIDVRGNYAYALDNNNSTFDTINIRNPSSPTLSGTVSLSTGYSYAPQLALSGNYAYTDTSGSLTVINISSSTPSIAATVSISGGIQTNWAGILISGHYLYADTANGLAVYDITNATSPQLVGTVPGITGYFTISGRYLYASNGGVYDLGGAFIQTLGVGNLYTGALTVSQPSQFQRNLDAIGGVDVGAVGLVSYGPGAFSSTGGSNVLEVTAATTSNSTGQIASFNAALIRNFATSSTASIIKSGLNIISQGSWTGTGATNIGLYVSSVTGGTNNYDAIFNGGGNVGIGTSTPYSRLQVTGPNSAATTSAFAVVNSASTTVFSVFDNGNSTYSGSIFQSSDQRLKTDVQSFDATSSLSAIELLNPVSYLRLDQPGTGESLGFIAQQVQQIFPQLVSTTSATALTPDGTLTLNYEGLIAPIVSAIQALDEDVQNLAQTITGFAQSFTTNQLCVNKSDGPPVCITGDQLASLLAAANLSQSGQASGAPSSDDSQATDTPPVIEINGDNPAIILVGATYNDLGATITGPQQDLNLGIQTYVDGMAMSPVQIDTTQVATDTIDYVATDQNSLTSTSTRTVIIEAAAAATSTQ